MINLIISILIAAALGVGTHFIFDSIGTCIFLGIIAFFASMVVLTKMTNKKVMAIMTKANEMMQNIPKLPSDIARANLMDKCVDQIKDAYKYKNYIFFLEQQLNAQIGSIYYAQRKFKEAEPYLANAFIKNGPAVCMYACIQYRNKDEKGMIESFEKAVKFTPKMPLLWNLYAWCLLELKKRDEAIAVLNRGAQFNPSDKITKDNLTLIKNSGKIKMRDFQEQWYQFWLDDPTAMQREMQKLMMDKYSTVKAR